MRIGAKRPVSLFVVLTIGSCALSNWANASTDNRFAVRVIAPTLAYPTAERPPMQCTRDWKFSLQRLSCYGTGGTYFGSQNLGTYCPKLCFRGLGKRIVRR
jgi:hypothetical protein